eukprot:scaffold127740_cov63-Phaeocystis_antarctica.AAC.1
MQRGYHAPSRRSRAKISEGCLRAWLRVRLQPRGQPLRCTAGAASVLGRPRPSTRPRTVDRDSSAWLCVLVC